MKDSTDFDMDDLIRAASSTLRLTTDLAHHMRSHHVRWLHHFIATLTAANITIPKGLFTSLLDVIVELSTTPIHSFSKASDLPSHELIRLSSLRSPNGQPLLAILRRGQYGRRGLPGDRPPRNYGYGGYDRQLYEELYRQDYEMNEDGIEGAAEEQNQESKDVTTENLKWPNTLIIDALVAALVDRNEEQDVGVVDGAMLLRILEIGNLSLAKYLVDSKRSSNFFSSFLI
jgi:hypothetical protein